MRLIRPLLAAALCLSYASALWADGPKKKNWTSPAEKIRAQALADEIMSTHPELISVTFHGVPPGLDKVYTMFAGSFPDRIGNPDDPDDVDVITKGITIVDPRWHRVNDTVKKFVMMMPLRDAAGENVGLLVLAYKVPSPVAKSETEFLVAATTLRDQLKQRIPSYADLFKPAAKVTADKR
ncbi:MAG TPA: hypothetical protein VEP66_09890 [Myxococcales bacterium]|nr:hypothetical protein [Myxococcales bacterium]